MDEYIGMIKMFAGNFAPRGWAFCDGSLLSISQNTALFSILGTTYGGNGTTTFALPDLRGRSPLSWNPGAPGPGLSSYMLGEVSGTESVTLIQTQMPAHNHNVNVENTNASESSGNSTSYVATPGSLSGRTFTPSLGFDNAGAPLTMLSPMTLSATGGSQPHNNIQPYLAISYIICLYGLYPPHQ